MRNIEKNKTKDEVFKDLKKTIIFFIVFCICFTSLQINALAAKESFGDSILERRTVSPGGESFGIKLHTDGVVVVGLSAINTKDGARSPAKDGGIEKGDIIIEANGMQIKSSSQLEEIVSSQGSRNIEIKGKRGGKDILLTVKPLMAIDDGRYKLGIWVRDSTAGIGTVTFIDKQSGMFGGLGHSISDVDTNVLMPLGRAEVVDVYISMVKKGKRNSPGELKGSFSPIVTGTLSQNTQYGVFGKLSNTKNYSDEIPIGSSNEAHTGAATIRCTVDGDGVKEFDIEIVAINKKTGGGKNFLIKVTDKDLIAKTGGIVQGMSGSPIIQDGKLIGAVTHVLMNDPTKGYGIFIENMLDAAEMPMAKAS